MIGVPSVLTPTVDAMVAVPMLMITDVRTPAIITGAASGSSTFSSRCQALIPIPSATLSTDAGTAAMPASVPCRMGNTPYKISAMMAGSCPKPIAGTAIASTATGGKVCPVAAMVSTSGRNSLPAGLVTAIPAPVPSTMAITLDTATSQKCARVRLTKLSCWYTGRGSPGISALNSAALCGIR